MYQPEWRNGREHGTGRRDAAARFEAIAEYLGDRRGFTVLDFGAYGGYFSARLADQFDAECTAVDDSKYLTEAPGVTTIRDRLTPAEIRKLGHFDATLCLSVLHHIPKWKDTLAALLDSAPIVFVETANPDETLPKAKAHKHSAAIASAIEEVGAVELTRTPGYDASQTRPLWVIDNTPHPDPDAAAADSGDASQNDAATATGGASAAPPRSSRSSKSNATT